MFCNCGPNHYAYFTEEPTDDPLVRKLRFVIQEVEPTMDCSSLHATNFYVPGFNPNISYIVVDNQGAEHPVVNKTPQTAYRPFVEDGKVWKVGSTLLTGNLVNMVEYYYFDGDTIIVENSREYFTGTFEVQLTGIDAMKMKDAESSDHIYNLQGQRLSSVQKGVNIVNRQKVYIK